MERTGSKDCLSAGRRSTAPRETGRSFTSSRRPQRRQSCRGRRAPEAGGIRERIGECAGGVTSDEKDYHRAHRGKRTRETERQRWGQVAPPILFTADLEAEEPSRSGYQA